MSTPWESTQIYYSTLIGDLAAGRWRVHGVPERQQELHDLSLEVQDFAVGQEMLELACGLGYWTRLMCSVARGIYALDINQQTLELARKSVLSPSVEFVVGDALALELPTNKRFTAVFGGFWLSHLPRRELRSFFHGLSSRLRKSVDLLFVDNDFSAQAHRRYNTVQLGDDTYEERPAGKSGHHLVLKNCLGDQELISALDGIAVDVKIQRSLHYWRLRFSL